MKKTLLIAILLLIPVFFVYAQTQPIHSILYQFSPLSEIIARSLGMEDKNNNGVIDKNAGEGYETFIEKYGIGNTYEEKEKSVDRGFHSNVVIICAGNSKLEENEIVNHYYINIRFSQAFTEETNIIEAAIKSYIYENNLPLVWLDDEQGTVMNAVTRVLGAGWNNPNTARSEDEAVRMFTRAVQGIRITGRTGLPSANGGYYTLPEMVNRRAGYCYEIAQFGFWFFSELQINVVSAIGGLTSSILHEVVRLNSGRRVDYFGSSGRYRIPEDNWYITNPIQNIGFFYRINGKVSVNQIMLEYSVIYNKYSTENISVLMYSYIDKSTSYYPTIIELGEFFFANNDISQTLNARHNQISTVKGEIRVILIYLLISYNGTNNKQGHDRIAALLENHFASDAEVREYLRMYRL